MPGGSPTRQGGHRILTGFATGGLGNLLNTIEANNVRLPSEDVESSDRIAVSVWEPGRSFVVTCFGECPRGCDELLATITLRIEARAGMMIDEYITAAEAEHSGPAEVAKVSETIPVVKIVLNLCVFVVEDASGTSHWTPDRMAQFSSWLRDRGIERPDNLWAGTSITARTTTSRIKSLLKVGTPRTTRFLSVEPQVEPIDLGRWLPRLDWVIQGGESGRLARPFDVAWAVDLIGQCRTGGVPYFLKQLGSEVVRDGHRLPFGDGHAGDWTERPEEVRVREMPGPEADPPGSTLVERATDPQAL